MLITLAIIFSTQLSLAQRNMQDVVYAKDGSIYRGMIKAIDSMGTIRLITFGNNELVFKASAIDSAKKEKVKSYNPFPVTTHAAGYFNQTGFGLLAGENGSGVHFETINGYRFCHWLELGGGLALDYSDMAFVPLYFTARIDLFKSRVTPILNAGCGYGFLAARRNYYFEQTSSTKYKGGLYYNAGAGIKVNTRNETAMVFSFSWDVNRWSYDYDWNDYHTHYDYVYQRIGINFALEF